VFLRKSAFFQVFLGGLSREGNHGYYAGELFGLGDVSHSIRICGGFVKYWHENTRKGDFTSRL